MGRGSGKYYECPIIPGKPSSPLAALAALSLSLCSGFAVRGSSDQILLAGLSAAYSVGNHQMLDLFP